MPKSKPPNKPKLQRAPKPVVEVEPYSYQPSRAELREDMSIPTTPEELAKAVVRDVTVVTRSKKGSG